MSKQRLPSPAQYAPKGQKPPEEPLDLKPCLVCRKAISDGYYGAWQKGGTCCKTCEAIQEAKPCYPGFEESDFFARLEKERSPPC